MTATLEKDTTTVDRDERPAGSGRGPVVRALVLMAVVGAALAALIVVVADRSDAPTVDPYEVTVDVDTAAGLAGGDVEDVVPAIIRLQPGQELVLRNNDFSPHTLGDLTAERGATVRMSFPSEGRNITATSLRRDGRLTILVEAPR